MPMHMATVTDITRTLTIAEAADPTGLTCKAIRSRVDRGTIRAVLRDGVRRTPHSERARTGLLEPTREVAAVVGELLDRLER
jgi:hypothetical protein